MSSRGSSAAKIVNSPAPPEPASSSGGDGPDARLMEIESRLREVEKGPVQVQTKLESLATKTDIADIKTLIETKETTRLRWLVGILITAIMGLGIAVIRTFFVLS